MSQPPPQPDPDVSQNLGELLKKNPRLFRMHTICTATMRFLELELMAVLVRQNPSRDLLFVKINCVNAVDYAVRPKPSNILEGGSLVEYFEEHPRLQSVGQDVPHSDGLEYFKPPIKFTLLVLEDTYVIAERFEMITLQ